MHVAGLRVHAALTGTQANMATMLFETANIVRIAIAALLNNWHFLDVNTRRYCMKIEILVTGTAAANMMTLAQ